MTSVLICGTCSQISTWQQLKLLVMVTIDEEAMSFAANKISVSAIKSEFTLYMCSLK